MLTKLNDLQRRFNSELNSINCQMSDFEAAVKRLQPQNEVCSMPRNVTARSQNAVFNVPTVALSSN